ncbi:MAG: DUF4389 domain-containing protein [Endozoicomonas sp.]
MDEKLIENLKSESRWLRLVFMVLFAMAAYVAGFLIFLVAVVQLVHGFIKGQPNGRLLTFSAGLNQYVYQIVQFVTYNTETKPYPFSDWPQTEDDSASD